MNSNFCDRCGCQLTDENTAGYGEGKYDIKLNNYERSDEKHTYRYGDGIYYNGRYLMFCKECQKIIDRVIENECFAYLPEKTVVDVKKMKAREG